MGIFIRLLIFRLVQLIGRILAISGLLLLAVLVGIFGGLWSQSGRVTQAALSITGLSLLDGYVQGPFYWIVRVVLFALMLVVWVISCFVVVWLTRMAFGVNA